MGLKRGRPVNETTAVVLCQDTFDVFFYCPQYITFRETYGIRTKTIHSKGVYMDILRCHRCTFAFQLESSFILSLDVLFLCTSCNNIDKEIDRVSAEILII